MKAFFHLARVAALGIGLLGAGGTAALAQNLTAGKTPEQLYAQSCSMCHARPQALASVAGRGLEGFLRQHYTSSREDAAVMAAYVRGQTADEPRSRTGRAARPSRGGDHARGPDERAPLRSRRNAKPDESRPLFDTAPSSSSSPAESPAAAPSPAAKPTEQNDAAKPVDSAPVVARSPEPAAPAAVPAAEPAREPSTNAAAPAAAPATPAPDKPAAADKQDE